MSAAPIFGFSADDDADHPAGQSTDLFGQAEKPSHRFACEPRKRAFEAWMRDGRPWPPPAGLTGAIAGAALGERRKRR